MIHFEARGKVAASNSTNAVSFSSAIIHRGSTLVLVRFYHVASGIVKADHGIR